MFTEIRVSPKSAGMTQADVAITTYSGRFADVARFIYANAPAFYGLSDDEGDQPTVLAVRHPVAGAYSFTLSFAEDAERVLDTLADREPTEAFRAALHSALHAQPPQVPYSGPS